MSTIPTSVTENQFEIYILPDLSRAKRGYVCKIPLHKVFNYILYRLHTGCRWEDIPIEKSKSDPTKPEISPSAVAYHYRKWSRDGSLERVWSSSIKAIKNELNLSIINLDGSHAIAKKGGKSVAYQSRKRAKTTNILAFTDAQGYIVGASKLIAGNHNDAFNLTPQLQSTFKAMKRLGLSLNGSYLNADPAFDTKSARKTCFNHGLVPNVKENIRNRKKTKRGPKRLFDKDVYKRRFASERTFAWIDKFKALLIRFDFLEEVFMANHYLAFTMINLRHAFAASQ